MSGKIGPEDRIVLARAGERLGPQIRALAKKRGVTVTHLSEQVGYQSRSSFYNAINCRSDPSLATLLRIAAILKLRSVEELFGDFGSDPVINPK